MQQLKDHLHFLTRSCTLLTVCTGVAFADEAEAAKQKAQRDLWTKYYAAQLDKYAVHVGRRNKVLLDVDRKAKLRWGNPLRTSTHGDVFVWTKDGRVELVGTIFSYEINGGRRVAHEFHSMSDEPVSINREGRTFTIAAPGVKYDLIPNAPDPAPNRAIRMAQMRRLSKSFTATLLERNTNTKQPLRPLNQALYRFETKEVDNDGAVFAYVMGTDPELLVAIESRPTEEGPKWHFAAGRFASEPLELMYKKKVVWKFGDGVNNDKGHMAHHGIDFQPLNPNVPKTAATN